MTLAAWAYEKIELVLINPTDNICPYDEVKVKVMWSESENIQSSFSIGLYAVDQVAVPSVRFTMPIDEKRVNEIDEERYQLLCDLDPDHCTVQVVSTNVESNSIRVTFQTETNAPEINDRRALDSILKFTEANDFFRKSLGVTCRKENVK